MPRKLQWISSADVDLNGKKVLLVDDVDDCRTTLIYAINELRLGHQNVDVAVMVVHNKLKHKDASFPEGMKVFVGENIPDKWAEYPYVMMVVMMTM